MSGECNAVATRVSSLSTGLDAVGLRKTLADSALSTGSMQALATALQMDVDLFNNWQVTYSGQPLMSSSDSRYWPACLGNGDSCASTGSIYLPVAQALNAAFRWCPAAGNANAAETNSTNLMALALGCDGGTGHAAELNVIKWRVMRALWTIASSGGVARPGMFTMPMPVATYPQPVANATALPYPSSSTLRQLVPVTTVATTSCLLNPVNAADLPCAAAWTFSNGPNSSQEVYELGTARDVTHEFGEFTAHAPAEIAPWYRQMYGQPGLKQVHVANSEIDFSHCDYEVIVKSKHNRITAKTFRNRATPTRFRSRPYSTFLGTSKGWPVRRKPGTASPAASPTADSYPYWQILSTATIGGDPAYDTAYYAAPDNLPTGFLGTQCSLSDFGGTTWVCDEPYMVGSALQTPPISIATRGPSDRMIDILQQGTRSTCDGPSQRKSHAGRDDRLRRGGCPPSPNLNPTQAPAINRLSDIVELEERGFTSPKAP